MNKRCRVVAVGLAFLGMAAGCGPDGGTGTNPGTTPGASVPIEQLQAAIVPAACDAIFRCNTGNDLQETRALFGTVENCRAQATTLGSSDVDDLRRAVTAGTVRYDGAAARRCVDQFATACNFGSDLFDGCQGVFTGTVAVGGMCWRSEECAGDAYCSHESAPGSPRTCPGRCTARVALGAQCSGGDSQCTRNGVTGQPNCDTGSTPGAMSVCVDRRNGAPAAEGAACGLSRMGATVQVDTPCATGLVCVRSTDPNTGTCRRGAALGAACGAGMPCGQGYCVPSGAGGAGTCMNITVQTTVGARCSRMGFPEVCSPFARLRCGMNNTCESLGNGAVGSMCTPGDLGMFQCNAGLYCDRPMMRCAAKKAVGAACESGNECQTDSCIENVCAARICR